MEKENYRLDHFFMKYRDMVIRNAYLFVKDYHVAEDICQETFIRLDKNLDYVMPEKVGSWLVCVSERLAVDYLRKGGKYRTKIGLNEADLDLMIKDYSDLSSLFEKKEEYERTGKILERLKKEKPLWYDVLCMSCFENMDNSSIGKELGIKPALVSKWKERAKHWLKSAYKEEYRDGSN